MAVNFATSLLPSVDNAPSVLAWNCNYINDDRQIFLAVIGAVVIATILTLTGTFLLCANVSVGLSFVAAIVLGLLTIAIGGGVLAYVLFVTLRKMRTWLKNFIDLKNFIQPKLPQNIPQQRHSSKASAFFCSAPLDVELYGSSWLHPMSRSRIVLSVASILIGVSFIVASVVTAVLWEHPLFRLDLGLGIVGASVLVAGLCGVRSYSLVAQGASYIYLNHYQKFLKEDLESVLVSKERKIENLEALLELDQELCDQRIGALEEKNQELEANLSQARQAIETLKVVFQKKTGRAPLSTALNFGGSVLEWCFGLPREVVQQRARLAIEPPPTEPEGEATKSKKTPIEFD